MQFEKILFLLTLFGSTLSFLASNNNHTTRDKSKIIGDPIGVSRVKNGSNFEVYTNGDINPIFNFKTHVTFYVDRDYKGWYVTCSNLEDNAYYHVNLFNVKLSSLKINQGSCLLMHEQNPPGGEKSYADKDYANLDFIPHRISTISAYGSVQHSQQCPLGSFVKRIRWDSTGGLKYGIDMYCYSPENKISHTAILSTHSPLLSNNYNGEDKMCTAGVRGIQNYRNYTRQTYYQIDPICTPDQPSFSKFMCKPKELISGYSVTVELITNHIKTISYSCRKVGDIEKICAPKDEFQTLLTCDASGATVPLKCNWQKKVGLGIKALLSESELTKKSFYTELGFEIGTVGYDLSANFKSTIGESLKTSYNWISTQESTWTQEVTIPIEIEVPPKCKTVVSEIFGKCSFMAVRPYHITRNYTCLDINSGQFKSFITQVIIPGNIQVQGNNFTSNIPDNVVNFIN